MTASEQYTHDTGRAFWRWFYPTLLLVALILGICQCDQEQREDALHAQHDAVQACAIVGEVAQ